MDVLNKLYKGAICIIAGYILFNALKQCNIPQRHSKTLMEQILTDSLETYRNDKNELVSRINVLEGTSTEDLLIIKSKDSVIIELQKELARNKESVKHGGSITIIHANTNVNSNTGGVLTTGKDTLTNDSTSTTYLYPEYTSNLDSLYDGWIVGKIKQSKDSLSLQLKIKHDFSIVIGKEKQGLFKYKPFAEITSKNPYDTITALRTYEVTIPPPKIGKAIGAGILVGLITGILIAK